MKFLFILLFPVFGYAQTGSPTLLGELFTLPKGDVVVKYDTSVLYAGKNKCNHSFANEISSYSGYMGIPGASCAVYHGETGCPDTWYNGKSICIYCYRHIQVKETRYIETPIDVYAETLEKLHKLKTN